MITIIPIEPLSNKHALLIIEAFNRHFINDGDVPEEWLINESSRQLGNGHI